jgi:hypothetical protein
VTEALPEMTLLACRYCGHMPVELAGTPRLRYPASVKVVDVGCTGTITAANEELEWEGTIVNDDPYGKGWLAKITLQNRGELGELLRPGTPAFAEHIAAERTKYAK